MAKPAAMSLGVIILAAGKSSRMGRPKMLLPWGKSSIIGHLISVWQGLLAEQIAVVCAVNDAAINAELQRLQFPPANQIINPAPEQGMFSSVQCAARWNGWKDSVTHWAIVLGDQPHLRPATIKTLLDFASSHPTSICQPISEGHGRHPVILPKTAFQELAQSKAETFKEFLQPLRPGMALLEMSEPGLGLDLDRPEDYERALRLMPGEKFDE